MGQYVDRVGGNNAAVNVADGLAASTARAQSALSTANTNLGRLANFDFFTGRAISVSLGNIDTTPTSVNFPDAPIQPSLDLNLPNFPPDITLNAIPQVDFGTAPTFDKPAPDLLFPATPSPSTAVIPTSPTIDTDQVLPNAPIQVIPAVPTLLSLNVPVAPIINLPVFTAAVPTQSIVVPGNTFFWSEDPYTSTNLSAVTDALLDRLGGGTGLSPTIENQIWDRARQREGVTSARAREEQLSNNAQTGFSRPTGSTLAAVDQIIQNTQNQSNTLSRDVAIKQAELEQSNLENTIQSIISLEQILIGHHNNIQARALEAERFTQDIFFNIFNLEVAKYNTELETYKAFVLAFETQLRAEIQKLEVYKSELEGQKLVGDINQQFLQIYTAELQGLQTEVDLYRGQLEGVNLRLQSENIKIEVFKSEVDAFNSQIQAKNSEFQGFSTAVSAETSKIDAYTSEVRAFASRVDAYSRGVDADRIVTDVAIEIEKLRIQQQSLRLDTYSKRVNSEISAFQVQTLGYQGATTAFSAEVGAETARLGVESRSIDQRIAHAQVQAQIAIENSKIALSNIQTSSAQGLEATKATAEISASLASSSLAGISIGASVAHNLSLDNNLNESYNPTV